VVSIEHCSENKIWGKRAYLIVKMHGVGRTVKAAPVRIMTMFPIFMFALDTIHRERTLRTSWNLTWVVPGLGGLSSAFLQNSAVTFRSKVRKVAVVEYAR